MTLVLLIEGSFYAYNAYLNPHTKQVRRRLRVTSQGPSLKNSLQPVQIVRHRATSSLPWLERLIARVSPLLSVERVLIQANSHMPLAVFVLLMVVCAAFGGLAALLKGFGVWTMMGCAAGSGVMPYVGMRWKRQKRFKEFQRQLPDALDLIARSLRAGHAFSVGMKMVGDEFPDPIGPEMERAVEEISFGIEIPEALKKLSDRIESVDLKFFVTALIIQRETGGNLAEVIESISRLIRLRFELFGRIKALSAEGKLSAYVLFALPLLLLFGLSWLNPDYMDPLFTNPTGQTMLIAALVWMGVGAIVMKRMVNIKV